MSFLYELFHGKPDPCPSCDALRDEAYRQSKPDQIEAHIALAAQKKDWHKAAELFTDLAEQSLRDATWRMDVDDVAGARKFVEGSDIGRYAPLYGNIVRGFDGALDELKIARILGADKTKLAKLDQNAAELEAWLKCTYDPKEGGPPAALK